MTRHINLLDAPQKKRSPWESALQMGLPIAIVVLVMGTWAAVVHLRLGSLKRQLTDIEAQMRPISDQLAQMQAGMGVEQVNATLRDRLERAQSQLKARKDIQTALQRGDLGSSQGFSEVMRAFARQTVAGVWLTGLRLENGGHDITLAGRTLNAEGVATLMKQLRAEPALRGRSIATMHLAPVPLPEKSDAIDADASQPVAVIPPVYEFQISSIAPTTDMPAPDAPAAAKGILGAVQDLAAKALK